MRVNGRMISSTAMESNISLMVNARTKKVASKTTNFWVKVKNGSMLLVAFSYMRVKLRI